ncbi:MAG: flippase-like domain-containing protein [Chitinophagales bacterium]|nr:flippase-like domain-containing protein [Chitinophagales bacterium]
MILKNKYANAIIKLLIFIGLLWILYLQVFKNKNLEQTYQYFIQSFDGSLSLLIVVIVLMFLNWFIESVKWKLLIDKLHIISRLKALRGVFFGVTFSLFTPNRVGEFGGRIFAINTNRKEAIAATLMGSIAQFIINLSFGGLGLLLYLILYYKTDFYLAIAISFSYLIMIFALQFSYFNLNAVTRKFKKTQKYIHIVELYNNKELIQLEIYSLLRYIIYVLQFIIMLYFFGFNIQFHQALVVVPAIFFLQTILPLNVAILDFGFRGNVALYFLSPFAQNDIAILATTFSIWLINLIIPAIIGGIAALQFKFFKE